MSGSLGRPGCWAVGLLALLLLVLGFGLLGRRDQAAGLGEEIQYDDFGFAVESVERRGASSALELRVRVANHAKRVPFMFDRRAFVLWDSSGGIHRCVDPAPSGEGSRSMGATTEIAAGGVHRETLVFEIPPSTHPESVRVSLGAGAFFDALDWVFFGDRRILLAPH